MEKTIKTILLEMKTAVSEKQTIPPTQWIDWALELNTLWGDLKMEMVKAEIEYSREIVDLMTIQELAKNKAELIAKSKFQGEGLMSPYEKYQYLKGRNEIVEEFIMLAKKRATIEKTF
jgi:hypothetical protein